MRPAAIVIFAVLVGSCGRPAAKSADEQGAPVDAACATVRGDSAQAVCLATRPEFPHSAPRRVVEVARRGDTVCVVTGPGEQTGTDGTVRVKVVRGAVVERVESDSIGCGQGR